MPVYYWSQFTIAHVCWRFDAICSSAQSQTACETWGV